MQKSDSGLYYQELYLKYADSKIELARSGPNPTWDRKVKHARDYMLEIENSNEDERLVLAVLVIVHIDLSKYYSLGQDYTAARNELEIAIDLAGKSGYTEAMYSALSSYGTLEFTQGNLDSAVLAYQKALPHAVSSDDGHVASTLMSLAGVWQFMPEKLDLAEAIAEWAVLVNPFTFGVFNTLYLIKLRRLGRRALRSSLKNIPLDSCINIAHHLAAYCALDDAKRAYYVANLGLDKANETNDANWSHYFKSFADRLIGKT